LGFRREVQASDKRGGAIAGAFRGLRHARREWTVIAFSGVLWSINPLLFGVAALYAACGSYVTLVLSRPLIKLNYDQFAISIRRSACLTTSTSSAACSAKARPSGARESTNF
jgi:hypothetical protein